MKKKARILKKPMTRLMKNRTKQISLKTISSRYRTDLIKNKTKEEGIFRYILEKLDIKFKFQHVITYNDELYNRKFFIVDFYIPKIKIVFEVDGKQHYTKNGIEKDLKRDKILKSLGYEVKRFRNPEVYNPRKCERRIKEILGIKTNKYF